MSIPNSAKTFRHTLDYRPSVTFPDDQFITPFYGIESIVLPWSVSTKVLFTDHSCHDMMLQVIRMLSVADDPGSWMDGWMDGWMDVSVREIGPAQPRFGQRPCPVFRG